MGTYRLEIPISEVYVIPMTNQRKKLRQAALSTMIMDEINSCKGKSELLDLTSQKLYKTTIMALKTLLLQIGKST